VAVAVAVAPGGVDVAVLVAVLVRVGVAVAVGVGLTCTSNAPMSQAAPCGRGTPRSSVPGGGQGLCCTPSMARLPGRSATVRLFPGVATGGVGGFSARVPSNGSGLAALLMSCSAALNPQEVPWLRLSPCEVITPAQLVGAPKLFSTMLFLRFTVAELM